MLNSTAIEMRPTHKKVATVSPRTAIAVAMRNSDDWALKVEYRDRNGQLTARYLSPIRMVGPDRMLALCLCREEPRQFHLSRCTKIELVPSAVLTMPMPIEICHETPIAELADNNTPSSFRDKISVATHDRLQSALVP